jgi:hypothetical protein
MEVAILPTISEACGAVRPGGDALSELRQALLAAGTPHRHDPARGTVEVGEHTVWIWASCSPYAVYGPGDWLPRRQFDSLPALLEFLQTGASRAA